jgi:SAM-dependent methyltransferase
MESHPHAAARQAWDSKPVLRTVYDHFYRRILSALAPGSVLEVGGGASQLKRYRSDVLVSDLMISPYVDIVADAQALPFAVGSFDNIVMLDVLHHIPVPRRFLAESERVLRPGGRLVMLEPAITPASYLFYRFLHPEPFDLSADPLAERPLSTNAPYDANQAIPVLLATRDLPRLVQSFPKLQPVGIDWLSFAAYPLSGGLRRWSLLSAGTARALLRLEDRMPRSLARQLAFRTMLVLERRS